MGKYCTVSVDDMKFIYRPTYYIYFLLSFYVSSQVDFCYKLVGRSNKIHFSLILFHDIGL